MAQTKLMLCVLLALSNLAVTAKKKIPEMYYQIADYHDVPTTVLYAVAQAESGRLTDGILSEPWPWTLNVDGKALYFESREAQFEALMTALQNGSIVDIGLMQLNWGWKYKLLHSPWMATEPFFNLNTACRIIREHFDANPDAGWFEAAGRYHREANTPKAVEGRTRYSNRVARIWSRL